MFLFGVCERCFVAEMGVPLFSFNWKENLLLLFYFLFFFFPTKW